MGATSEAQAALRQLDEQVGEAVAALRACAGVDWTGPAARGFAARVEEDLAGLARVARHVPAAGALVLRHGRAVDEARAARLVGTGA
ncbi:hypothetical protein GXB85_11085 [Cellulomonas sp. APG4]|uniref:hypothetical protein n=1 Tax=Cellulomonas sp. APG4 TaxID=1538656 RepID=UPI00137AD699|nr:hypothetical protein [Cellulomonas sp. APG4]NCT91491.1 hypothetical protein [Cellulomonas sp. APG4]